MHTIRATSVAVLCSACAATSPQTDEPAPLETDRPASLVMPISGDISETDRPLLDRCNWAIAESAAPFDPVAIETNLTEPVRDLAGGARVAMLLVKIDYLREGGIEPRSATVACTMAADGQVSVDLPS